MADQKIKLVVEGDTGPLVASFNNAISQIEKRINNLKVPAGMFGGNTGMAGGGVFQNSGYRASSGGAQSIQQVAGNVPLSKGIATAALQERSNVLLQNILTELQRQNGQLHLNNLKQSGVGMPGSGFKASSGGGSGGGGGKGPGSGGAIGNKFGTMPAGGITSLSGLASFLGAPAAILGTAATAAFAAKAGESIRKAIFEAQYEARALQTQAYNTKGQAGQLLQSAFTGGGFEDTMFAKERAAGQRSGELLTKSRHQMNPFSLGAAITLPMYGLGKLFESTRMQNAAAELSHYHPVSAATAFMTPDPYKSGIRAEMAAEAQKQTDIEKNRPENQAKTLVKEDFDRNYQKNLAFQRQMGMSETQFRNFNIEAVNSGFMPEQSQQAASSIMGAGGGTRVSRGTSAFALQMAKQFDLTNAPQALGAIGGQLGSTQMSKEALIKIQAEGTRLGLNQSNLDDENRKFVEMASAAIGRSSASSTEDVASIVQGIGKFMVGANTMQSLTAGQSAYEAYNAQSKSQSGPSSVLRQASMRKDRVLGQLSEKERAALSLMSIEEIRSSKETIEGIAQKHPGINPQDIVGSMEGVVAGSTFVEPDMRKALDRLKKAQERLGGNVSSTELKKREAEYKAAHYNAVLESKTTGFASGMEEKESKQLVGNFMPTPDKSTQARMDEAMGKEAIEPGAPRGGRPGDTATEKAAQFEKLSNAMFLSMITGITNASTATTVFKANIDILTKALQKGDPKAIEAGWARLNGIPASDQHQAGTGGPPRSNNRGHGG